jgi:hypothetical protein
MSPSEPLRVAFVRGVTPDKWERAWNERRPDRGIELSLTEPDSHVSIVKNGGADLAFVRLPVERDGLNLIPLYTEIPVVVAPRDHAIAAVDEVSAAELEDEQLHEPVGDIGAIFTLVAAGIGLVVVPQPVARQHARRDLVSRPVTDLEGTQVALCWPSSVGDDDRDVGDFIGIVRGRTARSSRGAKAAEAKPAATKSTAAKAAAAKATKTATAKSDRSAPKASPKSGAKAAPKAAAKPQAKAAPRSKAAPGKPHRKRRSS